MCKYTEPFQNEQFNQYRIHVTQCHSKEVLLLWLSENRWLIMSVTTETLSSRPWSGKPTRGDHMAWMKPCPCQNPFSSSLISVSRGVWGFSMKTNARWQPLISVPSAVSVTKRAQIWPGRLNILHMRRSPVTWCRWACREKVGTEKGGGERGG